MGSQATKPHQPAPQSQSSVAAAAREEANGDGAPHRESHAGGGDAARGALGLGDGGNIDKIRDILFGSQMREFERRVARMEERLLKEQADAREDARRRFEALEAFMKGELESLGSRVKAEQDERADGDKEGSRLLAEATKGLDRKLAQLDEQTTRQSRELRQQILDQSNTLRDELRQAKEQLAGSMTRQSDELRVDKVDRAALAGFLSEVAMRLSGELKIPE